MIFNRRQTILGLGATGAMIVAGAPSLALHTLAGPAFGSNWRVIASGHPADAAAQRSTIERIISEVDAAMSPYRYASELSRFNRAQSTDWQPISPGTANVATEALRLAAQTSGAFDPTVGPMVERYGFGPITGDMGRYDSIAVQDEALRKERPGLTLDLCGIAKGYALDRIAATLSEQAESGAMIEIGGEVMALGEHPDGRPWQVAVLDPNGVGTAIHRIVAPGGLALATSGHSENGLRDPVAISHIIDPNRGRTARMSIASVSVLAETGMQADAIATALCAVGAEDGILMAEQLGVSALFITDGKRAPREVMTGAFVDHVIV